MSRSKTIHDLRRPPLARRVLDAVRDAPRRWTAGMRMLPDFLIIGAQKSGTTSLYSHLSQHPCVGAAFEKEIDLAFGFRSRPTSVQRGVREGTCEDQAEKFPDSKPSIKSEAIPLLK